MPIIVVKSVECGQHKCQASNADESDELKEVSMVVGSNTLVDPNAVMIHVQLNAGKNIIVVYPHPIFRYEVWLNFGPGWVLKKSLLCTTIQAFLFRHL